MRTFRQMLSEARAPSKPKQPKNDYPVDTFKNHRGLEGGIIHVRGEIKPDERKMFDEKLKKHMMSYISKSDGPMSPESHAGAWLASNGHASFFEHGKASHGYVRDKTVAANDKDAIPGIVKTVRGKTTFQYTGNKPLTPELEQSILNHKGLNRAFGTDFTVAKD